MRLVVHRTRRVFSVGAMLLVALIARVYTLPGLGRPESPQKIHNTKGSGGSKCFSPPLSFLAEGDRISSISETEITLVFDDLTLLDYERHYFAVHPKARKKPIPFPYHESMNTWMIMKRPMMNALKQRWKDFIVWFVQSQGYANLHIDKCDVCFDTYYKTNRPHDVDNGCPKFIIDGLCESGLLVDDNNHHMTSLTLRCHVDPQRPRTEIHLTNIKY